MRRTILFFAAAMMLVGATTLAANAQHRSRNINQRQIHQQRRIYTGIRHGSLTPFEAKRLEQQEFRIDRVEDRYRDSGQGLNRWERGRLTYMQNRASRNIYRQKHDRQSYPYLWRP